MLADIYSSLNSMIKAIEVLSVIEGQRTAARIAIHEDLSSKVKDMCKKYGLAIEFSDQKIKLAFSGDYSTKGIATRGEGHYLTYIASSNDEARAVLDAEQRQDHIALGKLLGYPDCCVKFFVANLADESLRHNDFVEPAWKISSGFAFPIHNNIFMRYFDTSLLSHCPHNFACEKSMALAKERLSMIRRHDSNAAVQIERLLKCAAIYDNGNIYVLSSIQLRENEILYEHVLSNAKDAMLRKLVENKIIKIRSKNNFQVADKKYRIPVMVFC